MMPPAVREGPMRPASKRLPRRSKPHLIRPVDCAEPGAASSASAEPHRVRQFGSGPAGIEINAPSFLPPDDMSHGFDNIAASLTMSPTLMESYVRAAMGRRLAAGDPACRLTWRPTACRRPTVRRSTSKIRRSARAGGSPCGISFGRRRIHLRMSFYHYSRQFFGALQDREQIEVSVDGARVALLDVNLRMAATDELRTQADQGRCGPRSWCPRLHPRAEGPVQDFVMPSKRR